MKKNKIILLIFFSLSVILFLVWSFNGKILGTAESGLPFYNVSHHYNNFKNVWSETNLGINISFISSDIPTYYILKNLSSIGINNQTLQAMIFYIFLACSGIGIYKLTKLLFLKLPISYVVLGIFIYWFNPITLLNVWNRFLYNFMVFWALLPIALYLFLKGLYRKEYKYAVLTSLSTVLFSYALTSVPFNIILWFLFITSGLLFFLFRKTSLTFLIFYLLSLAITFALFNFWWIYQLFQYLRSPMLQTSISSFFSSNGNLGTLQVLSEKYGFLGKLFKIAHGGFSETLYWGKLYNFFLIALIHFIFFGMIIWILYKFRKKFEVIFLGMLLTISLFLMKGSEGPFGAIYTFIFINIPQLQIFRNPFEKFGFLLPLFLTPLFVFSMNYIESLLPTKKKKRIFFVSLFLYIFIVWGFPFWTGLVFTNYDKENRKLRSYETEVPEYYAKTDEWFKNQPGIFRFVSLPIGGEGMTYTWEKPYSGVELSSTLFETPNVSFNTGIPYFNEYVTELSKYQFDPNLLRFLPFINGKYILLRNDVAYKERDIANPETVKKRLTKWETQGLVKKSFESGELSVYEINENYQWPKVYTTENIQIINDPDLAKISKTLATFPEQKVVFVNGSKESFLNSESKTIVAPYQVFKNSDLAKYEFYSDRELIDKLFYIKHLPTESIYPLIKIRELAETPSKKDYYGWLLYKTGLLGKRAVEIYMLKTLNSSDVVIKEIEHEYEKEFKNLQPEYFELSKKTDDIASGIKDSLFYQYLLLNRINSKQAIKVNDFLSNIYSYPRYSLPKDVKSEFLTYRFEIPKKDFYSFANTIIPINPFYIDGKLMQEQHSFDLDKGIHELSIPYDETYEIILENNERQYTLDEGNYYTKTVDIPDKPVIYNVQFDYRFDKGNSYLLRFLQDNDLIKNPIYEIMLSKNSQKHDWYHWEGKIQTGNGADTGTLELIPVENKSCSGFLWLKLCKNFVDPVEVEIKNFVISSPSYPELLLESTNDILLEDTTKTNFIKNDSTSYTVEIEKNNTKKEMLVFSELFDPMWAVEYDTGQKIPDIQHFLVNNYANGWIIDRPGKYNILLSFKSQKELKKGFLISGFSIAIGITILLFIWIRKKLKKLA
jgi:hypothetical protein